MKFVALATSLLTYIPRCLRLAELRFLSQKAWALGHRTV